MARSSNQKLKTLYLAKFLYDKSDAQHPVTMKDILAHLENNDISAQRKSIYDDIEALRQLGVDIISDNGKYYIGSRIFETAELKLLVDAVQDSKFITRNKSSGLIKKIGQLTSEYDAKKLKRDIRVLDRVKTMNETIYYSVSDIHDAIYEDSSVTFLYNEWVISKSNGIKADLVPRRNGERYYVSPWTLLWDDENYYLVAYDHKNEQIRHYRVDKITDLKKTDKPRLGKELFSNFDKAAYSNAVFGMFAGESCDVRLKLPDRFIGIIVDRFGENSRLRPSEEGYFEVVLNVQLSPKFYSWVFSMGDDVKILSPKNVVEEFEDMVRKVAQGYEE